MVLETLLRLCVTEPVILEKGFLLQKLGKWVNFHLVCSIIKIHVFAVFLHKSNIWEKSCFWDIGSGLFLRSGFSNQLFFQKKLMKQPYFLHVDVHSQKLTVDRKFLVGQCQKWYWSIWFQESKIAYICKINRWN